MKGSTFVARGLACSLIAAALALWAAAGSRPSLAEENAAPKQEDKKRAKPSLPKVGQAAPDFEYTTLDGKRSRFSALKGKIVLLILFEDACGPCHEELFKVEVEVGQRMVQQGVVVLAVGRDRRIEELAHYQSQFQLTIPIAEDPGRAIYKKFASVEETPRSYVIDPAGKLVYESVGHSVELFEKLLAALGREIDKQAEKSKKKA